jgi:hypothetical protein
LPESGFVQLGFIALGAVYGRSFIRPQVKETKAIPTIGNR